MNSKPVYRTERLDTRVRFSGAQYIYGNAGQTASPAEDREAV